MVAIQVTITGRVQGVGFRAFVLRTAFTLGIRGEVWNAPDGSVRVQAEHQDKLHLTAFVRLLHDGPGEISEVATSMSASTGATAFTIGMGR